MIVLILQRTAVKYLLKVKFLFFRMAVLGYKKPLTNSDMWELSEPNQSEHLQSIFNKYWIPLVDYMKRYVPHDELIFCCCCF